MSAAKAEDVLAAKLFMSAAFPVMKIPLTEDESFVKKFENVNLVVEFDVDDDKEPLACYLVFLSEQKANELHDGIRFKVYQGKYDNRFNGIKVATLHFKTVESFLGVLKGNNPSEMLGIVPPIIKNIVKPGFLNFVFLFLSLTKMMPDNVPEKDKPFEQYLKVKMSLYMITTAMSKANRLGYKPFADWCAPQTDRIYQFKVGPTKDASGKEIYPEIGAFLRIKKGKTKAGRGFYERKKPFVLLSFPDPDGCIAVLSNKYGGFVEAVAHNCVQIVGAGDSYANQFNDQMTGIQNMLIPSKFVQ
ncbi:MAG: hypothetical protein Q4E28_01375 [Clostridia bacterium]|nr:hypothetical protein [Clostridia bacterium]